MDANATSPAEYRKRLEAVVTPIAAAVITHPSTSSTMDPEAISNKALEIAMRLMEKIDAATAPPAS